MTFSVTTPKYDQDGKIGVDFATTTTDQLFPIGTIAHGQDNTVWTYVQANGAITQYDWVAIDETGQANAGTTANLGDGWSVGFAQVAFADEDYGWVVQTGYDIGCRVGAACAVDVVLYSTTTPGVLDDSTAGTRVSGVVVATAGSTAAIDSVSIISTWPRSNTF